MNTKLNIIAITFLLLFGMTLAGNAQTNKVETIKIKTSAVCGSCKTRIENGLSNEKGIKEISLDLDTKIVTVKYLTAKTNPDEIRLAISKLGYDADDVKADKAAYDKLPACCKLDAPKH